MSRKLTRRRSCVRPCSMAREPRCASERKYTFFITVLFLLNYKLLIANYRNPNFSSDFAHHVLVPFRFEHQIDGGCRYTVNAFHLPAHVFHYEVGCRDVKLAIKRGYNIQLLDAVVEMIAEQQLLPPEYKDYKLIGNYSGCRECHITPTGS